MKFHVLPLLIPFLLTISFAESNRWNHLIPPDTNNEFSNKQAELTGLTGVFQKISVGQNERLTILVQFNEEPESEIIINGRDNEEVEIFIYNYPGRYLRNRKENVTELKIRTEKTTSSRFYDRPIDWTKSTTSTSTKDRYFEVLKMGDKVIFSLELQISISEVEQNDADNQ